MRKFEYGYLLLLVLIFSGCGTSQKPSSQIQAEVSQDENAVKRASIQPVAPASSQITERSVPGVQMGGGRQGLYLNIRGIVSTFAGKSGSAGVADLPGGRARFDTPKGIATDGIHLFVADVNSHTIRKIEIVTGKVSTLAGQPGRMGSNDGKAVNASFNRPIGVTTDGGSLFVTDSNNHCIRRIELESGIVTTLAGKAGVVGYKDGSMDAARFFIPEGITSDGKNLYVADTHNHSIRKIDLENGQITTMAGLSGAPGFLDDYGHKARFSYPKGITTDGRNLFVVDFGNHRVRKVNIASGLVSTLAGGEEIAGEAGGEARGESSRLNYPTGVTSDGRYLYLVDTFNRTIRKISLSNGVVQTIAGKAEQEGVSDGVGQEARFRDPVGITTDGNSLYVTDSGNHVIRKIR